MLLERFHLVKKGVDTIVEICDRFARNRIEEVANLIPTKTSELVNDSGFITSRDIPTIPTKTSQLENDSDFTTTAYVDRFARAIPTATSQLQNDSGFITASSLPTKTSQLDNDSGFITASAIPSNVSAFNNDANYATKGELVTATRVTTNVTTNTTYGTMFWADVTLNTPISCVGKCVTITANCSLGLIGCTIIDKLSYGVVVRVSNPTNQTLNNVEFNIMIK